MSNAQVKTYESFENFSNDYLNKDNDTTYVVNFWATWCRPCVQELPLFDSLNKIVENERFKMVLVSLDFKAENAEAFMKKRGYDVEMVVLMDPDSNKWINEIDSNWSGAIPYTLIWKGEVYGKHEKMYHSITELQNDINAIQ